MTSPMSPPDSRRTRFQQVSRYTFFGFAAIAAFFLITEHGAHLLGWLPFLLILACPLLHVFGHGGHGHGGHDHSGAAATAEDRKPAQPEGGLNPDRSNSPVDIPTRHHH